MKTGIIYIATNQITGKSYIGQTTNLHKRILQHKNDSFNKKSKRSYYNRFHTAIREYGYNNFIWQIICGGILEQYLGEYEVFYIDFYSTFRYGYNSTIGGEISPMKNPKIAKKVSDKMKKIGINPNLTILAAASNKGKKRSLETRKKMSLSGKGKKSPWTAQRNINNAATWKITKPDGETEIIKNLSKYCRTHRLHNSHITEGSSKGYKAEKI